MALIPYFDDDSMPISMFSHEMEEGAKRKKRANLYRALPNHKLMAEYSLSMIEALVEKGLLGARLRELIILRVGARTHAAYELHHHRRIARNAGLTKEEIAAAVLEVDEVCLSDLERLVLRYVDFLIIDVKAPKDIFLAVIEELGVERALEILYLTGFYMLLSRFLETTEVEIESE